MLFKNLGEALRVLQGTVPYSTDKSHVPPRGRSIADNLAVIDIQLSSVAFTTRVYAICVFDSRMVETEVLTDMYPK